ncbi:MAG: hypothetical protein GYB67_09300 [Chloroflexi bacterium]|nr:hypothetical protein [Chloroflexota bacterium]
MSFSHKDILVDQARQREHYRLAQQTVAVPDEPVRRVELTTRVYRLVSKVMALFL